MDLGSDVEESNQPKQPNSWIGLVSTSLRRKPAHV
jgi:hypothetical protein